MYRHQDPDTTIRSSNAYGILIIILPFPLPAYQGIKPKSRRSSRDKRSALSGDMLNARRTQRLTSGDDRVEFVGVEPVLGGPRGFGGLGGEGGCRPVEDEEPMLRRKGGSEWFEH